MAGLVEEQTPAAGTVLRTDHVDLYQAHRFDPEVPIEALLRVVDQGKACYLGFSEWTPEQIRAAIDIAGPRPAPTPRPRVSSSRRTCSPRSTTRSAMSP